MITERIRCAIYTRKSTEEGLDQEFNSLDAQREACEAYIISQRSLGWVLLPTRYDDGGISGGTMQRPALQALLDDIQQGRIDTVVVYKVDRLTRSLTDFQKIVETFDKHRVSFVSVTQQFNTTTSMGRLTLNMLLSFAQFEREVTGERIRDKIAASKQKGMWMGGPVPLGYDVQDRKLVINEAEAKTVETLFRLYLQLGTVQKLSKEADRLGLRTKRRQGPSGKETGGGRFYRGHLHQLLMNPIYVGEIAHQGHRYPGQQPAIIDRELFDAVQTQIASQRPERASRQNASTPSLLSGLVFDETGDRLTPTFASKQGRRYRYYISARLAHRATGNETGWRVRAEQLEALVGDAIGSLLKDPLRLIPTLGLGQCSPDDLRALIQAAADLASRLSDGSNDGAGCSFRDLLDRIDLQPDLMRVAIRAERMLAMLGSSLGSQGKSETSFSVPIQLKRRGVETKLVLAGPQTLRPEPDRRLVELVVQAHRWGQELISGEVTSLKQIAERHGLDRSDVGRSLQLAFLAPDLVEAILTGTQPVNLTHRSLSRVGELPLDWSEQRRMLGLVG